MRHCRYPLKQQNIDRYMPASNELKNITSVSNTSILSTGENTSNNSVVSINSKEKKWPKNQTQLVEYEKLISPIKKIIHKGYRLIRKDEKSFDYEGYSVGATEQLLYLSPKTRLSKKGLEAESTQNRTLLDVLLNIVFQLGIEQGRRHEKQFHEPIEFMQNALEYYRETNQKLRYRVDELESLIELKSKHTNLSDEDLETLLAIDIKRKQKARIIAFNEDENKFHELRNKNISAGLTKNKK